MIKAFGSTDREFTSNGDVVLKPFKCRVHKGDDYYLDFECDTKYVDYLIEGNIIAVDTPQGTQAFRISNPIKKKNKISIKAWHVFYDSERYLIADSYVVDKDCNDALVHLNNATMPISPFTVSSDVTAVDSFRCVRKSLYEAFSTVLERWGGYLVRDNFNVAIRREIGVDNGVTVQYRKNLKEITCEENWDLVVTQLLPVGKDGILLNAINPSASLYVVSDRQYAIPYTKTVSFTQDHIVKDDYATEEAYKLALVTDLRAQAVDYVNKNSLPQINYTLRANLEKITDIGDVVRVKDERLNVDLMTKVIAFEYDCILEKYTEIEFGYFTPSLSNLVLSITASVDKTVTTEVQTAFDTISQDIGTQISTINAVLSGGHVVLDGDNIYILDRLPKTSAVNVMRINKDGIAISNNGINGVFVNGWFIDGVFKFNKTIDLFGKFDLNATSNGIKYGDLITYDKALKSVGINCTPSHSNTLELNGVDMRHDVATSYLQRSVTNLTASVYTSIQMVNYCTAGTRLTAVDNSGIQIGAGVSKVMVSGHVQITTGSSAGIRNARIIKSYYAPENTLAYASRSMSANTSNCIDIQPTLVEVTEGEMIYLAFSSPDATDTIKGDDNDTYAGAMTSLTVQVIE